MENWQPIVKDENATNLELSRDYGFGTPIKTFAHISEGDTLYIRQENEGLNPMYIALTQYELYDILFNFMSVEELIDIAHAKVRQRMK